MKRDWGHRFRRLAVWALLAPFFLSSLISHAVMPVQSAGGIRLVLCSGTGPVELVIDPATGAPVKTDGGSQDGGSGHCDWANANVAVTLAPVAALPAIATHLSASQPPAPPLVLIAGRATGLPPSTGPPLAI